MQHDYNKTQENMKKTKHAFFEDFHKVKNQIDHDVSRIYES